MERVDKLIAFLKELRIKPEVDDFESKLVIQKSVCLLELMGAKLGYGYSLYVRGPYSAELTKELYDKKDEIQTLKGSCPLTEKEKNMAKEISEQSDALEPALLEIIATYSYLARQMEMSPSDATIKLKKLKPFYSEAQIAVGVNRAKILFPPSQKEVEEMKKEFSDWARASGTELDF
ncbi:MAG: hypothetical protein V1835_04295 [Candidatus Micrarchaeota archaeon]